MQDDKHIFHNIKKLKKAHSQRWILSGIGIINKRLDGKVQYYGWGKLIITGIP